MKYTKRIVSVLTLSLLMSCGAKKTTSNSKRSNNRYIDAEAVEQPTRTTNTPTKRSPVPVEIKKVEAADGVHADLIRRKPNLNKTTLAYIDEYNDIAILEMIAYGIPASITLAQGILESNSGKSRLSAKGNNHFGVKCHRSWKGKRMYHDDDARQECFRRYEHPLSSFRDHSLFLYGRDRYAALFDLRLKNYKGWARGLKKAGYATDPKYPNKLIDLIEAYDLFKYDDFDKEYQYNGRVLRKESKVASENDYIVVRKGDTLYSIAQKNKLTVTRLKWLNGLKSNEISVGQKLLVK